MSIINAFRRGKHKSKQVQHGVQSSMSYNITSMSDPSLTQLEFYSVLAKANAYESSRREHARRTITNLKGQARLNEEVEETKRKESYDKERQSCIALHQQQHAQQTIQSP